MVVYWLGELLVRGGAQSSQPPLSTLCTWLSCSLTGNHPFMLCVQSKNPHTYSPKFRFFPFQLRIYTRAWLCVQTHTLLCETCPRSRAAVLAPWWCSQQCLTELISRQPLSSAPTPSGFLQQQSKTPREFFSASIKTCWDSLTLSPPSGIFPQENIKCMWLSWAFPELCEGLGSHPGGSASRPFMAFSNVFKWN